MIRKQAQSFRYFLYSRHVSDALLITAGILIPAVLLARQNLFEYGVVVSLGAMCAGITDLQGPLKEKTLGMLVCNLFIFIVAVITGYAGASVYLESIEIILLCFFFSMFTVYGNRAASIGTTSLMVMITIMYKRSVDSEILINAALLLAGGLWYMLLSLLFYWTFPYRQTQQVLGECILEITKSLRLKARLYDLHTDQHDGLQVLVMQQIRINEKQDDVRQLLFSNPWIARKPSKSGKLLIATFVDLMDVYEQIVNTSYYETIREKFSRSGAMPAIENIFEKMADNLTIIGRAIQSNTRPRILIDLELDFIHLKKVVDEISQTTNERTFILKKTIITLRSMDQRLHDMHNNISMPATASIDHADSFQHALFLPSKTWSTATFFENLSFQSSTFRYALRVALVAFAGFVFSSLVSHGGHSYWILFTIVFILKPAFSLSKERNYQRIVGTLGGGMISFPVMLFVHNNSVLFVLLMVFMVIAYSFMRINYLVFVIFMTCYVLLMFKFIGTSGLNIVGERVIDTLIGASITFVAIYFVFPNWEFKQIRIFISDMLEVNMRYVKVLADYFSGKSITLHDYKLARKEAYVSFANMAASYQRMISEPKSKQQNIEEIQRFIILNHQLLSLIGVNAAAIFAGKLDKFRTSPGNLRYLTHSVDVLKDALTRTRQLVASPAIIPEQAIVDDLPPEPTAVKSQLKRILEQSVAIRRTVRQVFGDIH